MLSREELEIFKWFKHQASSEQKLIDQVSDLTGQVNNLNRNLNQCAGQLHQRQLSLNTASQHSQELEQALLLSERSRAICENDLQTERSAHALTKDYLAQEFAQLQRADSIMARQSQAMKNLSDFLALMQGASDEDKEATVEALTARENEMSAMMVELEDKKQALAKLEEQRKSEHAQFETTTKQLHEYYLNSHQHPEPTGARAAEGSAHGAPSNRRYRTRRARTQQSRTEEEARPETES